MKPHRIAIACALLLTGSVYAQEGPTGPGDGQPRAGTKLDRVEISSRPQSDTDLRRKSPVAKQIYGREELDKYGDQNVADVLKRLPGVNMAGGAPRMRGLGAGYTLILINGDPAPPGFAFDQLNPAQVERIEVTKAPTADQSAQAVAGSINIILKEAPRVSQRDLRLNLGYNAERPIPSATFTYGERVGPVSFSLPVSGFMWRGRNEVDIDRSTPAGTSSQDGIQRFWGHGFNSTPRLNWKINDEEMFTLQSFLQKGWWNNQTLYTPPSTDLTPTRDDDSGGHGTFRMARVNAQYTNRFSDTQRIELKFGGQDSRGTFDVEAYRAGRLQRHAVGDNRDRNLTQASKYAHALNDEHSLTVGWDLEWRKRDELRDVTEWIPAAGNYQKLNPELEGAPFGARIERQALFIQDEWEISPQWSTYLGVRGERIRTESVGTGPVVVNVSKVLTPLWHLNYKLDPKGRDMIRASLTRSYKAPDLNALLARPAINGLYTNLQASNTDWAPDRVGNPSLKPELATGLDLAYEKYMTGGGMFSVGVFHRKVTDLIRTVTTRQPETVSWAAAPRFYSRPVNFSKATSSGLELELKGRAGELIPALFDPKLPLSLRASVNFYHSKVDAVDGPNNRLDSQQPWSGNLGFDYRFTAVPVTMGASLAYTPGYMTRQTEQQWLDQGRVRTVDVFAQMVLDKQTSLRFSANNFAPTDSRSNTHIESVLGAVSDVTTTRRNRTWFGLSLEHKL